MGLKLYKNTLTTLLLTGLLGLPSAHGADLCENVFASAAVASSSVSPGRKAFDSVKAPVLNLANKMAYMEMPLYMSHPLYKAMESHMNPWQTKVAQKTLYYATNSLRKSYNALSAKGLGLPFPSVRTQAQRASEDQLSTAYDSTYWKDLSLKLDGFSTLRKAEKLSRRGYDMFILAISSLYALQTAGNIAQVAQSQEVLIPPGSSLGQILPLKDNQIQLLNETVPLPHLAIRIGNMVYSHGITHLTQTPVDLYLQSERLKQNAPLPDEMSLAKHISSFKRNIDSVILNLDEKKVLGIRDQLLKETQKQYLNKTFVNSCASMVVRVLVSQGVNISQGVLDASPSLLLSYLALEAPLRKLNKFGEPLISGFYTLVYAQEQNQKMSSFRNFMIRQMEAAIQLQIYSLPIHMAQRYALDHEQKSLAEFYLDSPERQNFLQSVREQADSDLRILQSYDLFSLKLTQLQTRKASEEDINKLKQEFAEEFKNEISQIQDELKDPGISFVQYNLDQFKIDLLTAASSAK